MSDHTFYYMRELLELWVNLAYALRHEYPGLEAIADGVQAVLDADQGE